MTVIISLGGSNIVPNKIDVNFLKNFKKIILKHTKKGKFIVMCGGGKTSRNYQEAGRKLGVSVPDQDWVGIMGTKANAWLVRGIFGKKAYKEIEDNPLNSFKFKEPVLVASGWMPGWSTDYDAAMLARGYKADTIINVTNVSFVYTADPKKNKKAKPLKKVSWKQYKKLVGGKWKPGLHTPFDPVASQYCERLKIKVIVMKGLDNLDKCLSGKKFTGTVIG